MTVAIICLSILAFAGWGLAVVGIANAYRLQGEYDSLKDKYEKLRLTAIIRKTYEDEVGGQDYDE